MKDATCGVHLLSREIYKSDLYKLFYCGWCQKLQLSTQKTWYEAKTECEQDKGKLPEPSDSEQNDAFYDLMKTYNEAVWIGCSGQGDNWWWQNNSTVNHTFWYPGDPNEKGTACVVAYQPTDLKNNWRDRDCNEKNFFLCNYPRHCFVVA